MSRKRWKGSVAPSDAVHPKKHHPLREIDELFGHLSDKGKSLALNLKFGPARTHGSEASLRAWPRGRPGQGAASWLSKRELAARIEGLKKFIGVSQITRF